MEPPESLSPEQRAVWLACAPHAIEQRTLVPSTVAGFRHLCELQVFLDALGTSIAAAGAATRDGERLLKTYTKVAQRLDGALARFKLTAFGKPVEAAPKKVAATANPWATVAGKR